jgi:hypothetical protein
MRRRAPTVRERFAGVLAALACSAMLWGSGSAGATTASSSASSSSPRLHPDAPIAAREVARVREYWTPARMRSAQPLDARGSDLASASFLPVSEPTTTPNAVNGRLFVKQGPSEGYCSATVIDSPTRRLVLTAGHCINSGPILFSSLSFWSRYAQFVPAYSHGTAPFGTFVARRNAVFAPRAWVKGANQNFDVGAMLVSPNARGIDVADAVGGGVTIALDLTRRQQFETFGYPGKSRVMQGCRSPYVGDDSRMYSLAGPPTIAISCHWAPGASGGGWLIDGGTAINGLTSYGKPNDNVHTFGPYFSRRNVGRLVAGM